MATDKPGLRTAYKTRLLEAAADQTNYKNRINALVSNLKEVVPAGVVVGAFKPLADELALEEYFDSLGEFCAYPRLLAREMQFCLPQTPQDFEVGQYKIRQPVIGRSRALATLDLRAIIVPALAFDRRGFRLGRGQGYYDRFLQHYNGLKIGVALSAQISNDDLPRDEHDVAMDIVITEDYIFRRLDA